MDRLGLRFAFAFAAATGSLALLPIKSAQGVQLDPGGLGQVVVYPYYTVHNHQQTLLSIINTSDADQVMQVTLREALNGRPVLRFQVWLGRKDSWTGTLFALVDDGVASDGAAIISRDPSCTTPAFRTGGTTSDGSPYLSLIDNNYSGAMSDGGPSGLARTRQGWIEVIALANVTGPLASSITLINGYPRDCGAIPTLASGANVATRPSGGLMGSASVIRVASGTLLSGRAGALSGFTEISLFNEAFQPSPDLASVNDGANGAAATAKIVDDQGRWQSLTYGEPNSGSRPIDAVSAVFMATRIKNEYQTSLALAASTDWVLTFPTKPFYTDPAIIGMASPALPPFDETFQSPGFSRVCSPYRLYDQGQRTLTGQTNFCSLGPSPPPSFDFNRFLILFQAANVVPFSEENYASPIESGVFAAPRPTGMSPYEPMGNVRPVVGPAGWLDLMPTPTNFSHRLPAAAEGKVLSGLPGIGYSASNIVNNNVSNGVLANYGYVTPHATSVSCTKARDSTPCD